MDPQVDKAMEILKFPSSLRSHPKFPIGVPPTIKTWGALLRWANEDPTTNIETLRQCIRELRKPYYQTLLISEQYIKLQQKQREEKERKRAERAAKELREQGNKENIPLSKGERVGRRHGRNLDPLKEVNASIGNIGHGKSPNLRENSARPRLSRSGGANTKASTLENFSTDMLGYIFECTFDDPSSKSTSQWLCERGFDDLTDFTMCRGENDGTRHSASRHCIMQMIKEIRDQEQDVWELRQRELAMAKHAPSIAKHSSKIGIGLKMQFGNRVDRDREANAAEA